MIQDIITYLLDIITNGELIESLQLDSHQNGPLHVLSELDCFQNVQTICKRLPDCPQVFELRNYGGLTPLLICLGKMFIGNIEKLNFDNIHTMIKQIEKDIEETRKCQKKFKRSQSVPDSPMGCAKLLLERITSDTVDLPHPKHKMTALQIVLNNVEKTFNSSDEEFVLVELLLRKGANVLISGGAGEPPIHLVNSQNFDRKLAVLFIEHLTPETINLQDEEGQTVLHLKVSQMDEEGVELILRKGANIMVKDRIVETEDIDITRPGMQTNGKILYRTPLLVALKNGASKIFVCFEF